MSAALDGASVLPPGSTDFEFATESAGATRLDRLPVPVAAAVRPLEAPDSFVPFLAWGRSADFWNLRWKPGVARRLAESSYELHRLKGTQEGIVRHVSFVAGARVVDVVAPPQGFFGGGSYDENAVAYDAWLRGVPELRIFSGPAAEAGTGVASDRRSPEPPPEAFLGCVAGDLPTFFAGAPEARPFVGVVASGGAEVPVSVRLLPDPRPGKRDLFEVSGRAPAGVGLFGDEALEGLFTDALDGDALFRRIAFDPVGPTAARLSETVVRASPDVQDAVADIALLNGREPLSVFGEDCWVDRYFDAEDEVVDRYFGYRLVDRAPRAFGGASAVDVDRFGIAPHTAELVVSLTGSGGKDALFADVDCADQAVAGRAYQSLPLDDLCLAVEAAMALRDEVKIDLDAGRLDFSRANPFAELRL